MDTMYGPGVHLNLTPQYTFALPRNVYKPKFSLVLLLIWAASTSKDLAIILLSANLKATRVR